MFNSIARRHSLRSTSDGGEVFRRLLLALNLVLKVLTLFLRNDWVCVIRVNALFSLLLGRWCCVIGVYTLGGD